MKRNKKVTTRKDKIMKNRKTLFISILLTLACFCFSPRAQALLPPPTPDGGYPGANTAEGTNALFNLGNGQGNTAIGYNALSTNDTGNDNTAVGLNALPQNTTGSD